EITITAFSPLAEGTQPRQGLISIDAGQVNLSDDASISAESRSTTPASNINIRFADSAQISNSFITTSAVQSDGGGISLAGELFYLDKSQLTTSVAGQGNGGDIAIATRVLVLNDGFIQANTEGVNASGGDILIDTEALISAQGQLIIGGDQLAFQPGINVIQAAAPDGISGDIQVNSPELNVSADMVVIDTALLDLDELAQNPCSSSFESALAEGGRGGLPAMPDDPGVLPSQPNLQLVENPRDDQGPVAAIDLSQLLAFNTHNLWSSDGCR
ncbi:MAG: hypothetical protein RL120_13225, partial [Gammaproteobacteria bacterium]